MGHTNHINTTVTGTSKPGISKFTESQIKERYESHARSIALGYPTIPQMVVQWKERFDVDITVQGEAQWQRSNMEAIERVKREMIEQGEILLPTIGIDVIANSMMELVLDMSDAAKQTKRKLDHALKLTKTDDLKKNTGILKSLASLTRNYTELVKETSGQLKALTEYARELKVDRKAITDAVDAHMKKKGQIEANLTPLELIDAEVTDEDRDRLLDSEEEE